MDTVRFELAALAELKKSIRKALPKAGSSKVSEALAWAMGFSQHAALLPVMRAQAPKPPELFLCRDRFAARLMELGVIVPEGFAFGREWIAKPRGDAPLKAHRVLVVDQSETIRKAVKLFLGKVGAEAVWAESPEEGLAPLRAGRIDCLLFEPAGMGDAALDLLAAVPEGVKIVAFGEGGTKLGSHVHSFLSKPFSSETLLHELGWEAEWRADVERQAKERELRMRGDVA